MARGISVLVCIALITALFIFPARKLARACDAIEQLAHTTIGAVYKENWAQAICAMEQMVEVYEQHQRFLHIIISHERVEQLEAALYGVLQLVRIQDQPQALLELEFIITHVCHLRVIEQVHLVTLF